VTGDAIHVAPTVARAAVPRRPKTHWFTWVMRLTLFFCIVLTGGAFDQYNYTYFLDECRGLITPSSAEFTPFFTLMLLLPALVIMISARDEFHIFISFVTWVIYTWICYPSIFPDECTKSAAKWAVFTFTMTILFTIFILLSATIFYIVDRSRRALHSEMETGDA
jgi:hypothetical protein